MPVYLRVELQQHIHHTALLLGSRRSPEPASSSKPTRQQAQPRGEGGLSCRALCFFCRRRAKTTQNTHAMKLLSVSTAAAAIAFDGRGASAFQAWASSSSVARIGTAAARASRPSRASAWAVSSVRYDGHDLIDNSGLAER